MADWTLAACREADVPSPFPDDWGVGRPYRAIRSQALALCRVCPVRLACGRQALAEVEAGLTLYGIRCGVLFTDVGQGRQDAPVARLRAVVAHLEA